MINLFVPQDPMDVVLKLVFCAVLFTRDNVERTSFRITQKLNQNRGQIQYQ